MSGLNQEAPLQAPAGADLSAKQYFFVVVDGSGELQLCGDNVVPDGVLQDAPAAGKTGTYDTPRGQRLTVIAGETIAVGEFVSVDATGRAHDADATGDAVVGKCLVGGAVGDEIQIKFTGTGVLVL